LMRAERGVWKEFRARWPPSDLEKKLFNATNHFNPRDVHAVLGAPRMGEFANSVPTILRGFMMLKW